MSEKIVTVSRWKIENIGALPTVPETMKQISRIIEKPTVTITDIASFVANDPALTTKVLKMVNSAAFGFPGRISSVSHAIMLLGLNVVRGLLLGVSVFEIMQKVMYGLWVHSVATATAARALGEKRGLDNLEELSVAGLLHDLGKALLILQYSQHYEKVLEEAARRKCHVALVEENYLGVTHATVGGWLTEKWNFPDRLVDMISRHHEPKQAKRAFQETSIIHVADILVRARGVGFAGDRGIPLVAPEAFEAVAPSREEILHILENIDASLSLDDDE